MWIIHQHKILKLPLLCVLLAVSSCKGTSTLSCMAAGKLGNGVEIESIQVIADAEMNHSRAVRLDVVFLDDADLIKQLPVNVQDWFLNKQFLMASYASTIHVASHHLVPQSSINLKLPNCPQQTDVAILYVDYLGFSDEASKPIEISDFRQLRIRLGRDSLQLIELDKP